MTGTNRKLAAILAADVVGFSRQMSADEAATLARVAALRADVLDPLLAEHRGRLFKTMGDGFLAEFASAVQAVACALAVQARLAEQADGLRLRIGVHQGDVVVQGEDLMGDGINIAARLEPLAEAGGIVISARVREDLAGKLTVTAEDMGDQTLKNIAGPLRAFRIRPYQVPAAVPALPDRPSIAVLPFTNMGGDPEQEYFADGVVEDIITALSRHRWLFVIARNSSFSYKGQSVDIRRVGRELGVRYVLEGSIRRTRDQIRFTAQLIDSTTGAHVWADRFDGKDTDLFDLQDRITESVVGILEPTIQQAEIERVRRKPPGSLDAYDNYLRGLALSNTFTRAAAREMLDYCQRAIESDPAFAPAYAIAARVYLQLFAQDWQINPEQERVEVLDLVERGLSADRQDSFMLGTAGHCYAWFARDLDKAIMYLDEAVAINSNHSQLLVQSGTVRICADDISTAIAHLQRAMRLSPRDPRIYSLHENLARAFLIEGNLVECFTWAQRAVQHNPNYLPASRTMAAVCALLGRDAEARQAAARVLAITPSFTISAYKQKFPWRHPDRLASSFEGLRLAGLPE